MALYLSIFNNMHNLIELLYLPVEKYVSKYQYNDDDIYKFPDSFRSSFFNLKYHKKDRFNEEIIRSGISKIRSFDKKLFSLSRSDTYSAIKNFIDDLSEFKMSNYITKKNPVHLKKLNGIYNLVDTLILNNTSSDVFYIVGKIHSKLQKKIYFILGRLFIYLSVYLLDIYQQKKYDNHITNSKYLLDNIRSFLKRDDIFEFLTYDEIKNYSAYIANI